MAYKFSPGDVYVHFYEPYQQWGVFCTETNFCFGLFDEESDAETYKKSGGMSK